MLLDFTWGPEEREKDVSLEQLLLPRSYFLMFESWRASCAPPCSSWTPYIPKPVFFLKTTPSNAELFHSVTSLQLKWHCLKYFFTVFRYKYFKMSPDSFPLIITEFVIILPLTFSTFISNVGCVLCHLNLKCSDHHCFKDHCPRCGMEL